MFIRKSLLFLMIFITVAQIPQGYGMKRSAESSVIGDQVLKREQDLALPLLQCAGNILMGSYVPFTSRHFTRYLETTVTHMTGYSLHDIVRTKFMWLGAEWYLILVVVLSSHDTVLLGKLIEAGADLSVKAPDGLDPFELAIARRKPAFVRMLIAHEKGMQKFAPWLCSDGVAFLNNIQMMRELLRSPLVQLSAAYDFNYKHRFFAEYRKPKNLDQEYMNDVQRLCEHLRAASSGQIEHAVVDKQTGNTVLHSLAELGRSDLLTRAHSRCYEKYNHVYNRDGFMPIHVAVMAAIEDVKAYGALHPGLVTTIVTLSIKDRKALEHKTVTGFTSLQLAVRYDCAPVIKLLVDLGADGAQDAVTTEVYTPFRGPGLAKVSLRDELATHGRTCEFDRWVDAYQNRVNPARNQITADQAAARITLENWQENSWDELMEQMRVEAIAAGERQRVREVRDAAQLEEAKRIAAEAAKVEAERAEMARRKVETDLEERERAEQVRKQRELEERQRKQLERKEALRKEQDRMRQEILNLPAAEAVRRDKTKEHEQDAYDALLATLQHKKDEEADRLRRRELMNRQALHVVPHGRRRRTHRRQQPVADAAAVEVALQDLVLEEPEQPEISYELVLAKQSDVIACLNRLTVEAVGQVRDELEGILKGIDNPALLYLLKTQKVSFSYHGYVDGDGNEVPEGTIECTLVEYYQSWNDKVEDEGSRAVRAQIIELLS